MCTIKIQKIIAQIETLSIPELIPILTHEIAQSLVVINAYISGSIQRIKNNSHDKDELLTALNKVSQHADLVSQLIQSLQQRNG